MRLCLWVVLLLACVASSAMAQEKPLQVLTSFSILADMVKQVGGERVEVTSLVAAGEDAHVYEPTPQAIRQLASADLFIINGLGFEGWLTRLLEASNFGGTVITAAATVQPLMMENDDHDHHHHSESDPHAWQNVRYAMQYVAVIRDALIKHEPAHTDYYNERATSYLSTLEVLDAEIRASWAAIPKEKRNIITSHDAFGYYAKAYDVNFFAPLGISSDSEPSAKDLAALMEQIRRENIRAIFIENISNSRLMNQLAKDTGITIGGVLYSDSLSDTTGEASTYVDMMRHNTRLMQAAIR